MRQLQPNSPQSEDKRGLYTAMAMWLLMNTGYFLLIPLLSVHFVDGLGWAAAYIGVVLATRQFLQQGLAMFGGALADRYGPKRLIMAGILIRSVSFVFMGYATSHASLLLAVVMAALGGALFDAPIKATIAVMAAEESISDVFAKIGVLQNLARTAGPLLGALLIQSDFRLVGLAAAGFFLLALFVALIGLPNVQLSEKEETATNGLHTALLDRAFIGFTALMMGFWFMWVQLSIALPLRATALTGDAESVGILFAVNAVAAIILQVPVLRFAQRFLFPLPMLIMGMALMALGLGSVAFVQTVVHLYFSVFFFALGSILVMPNAQTITATMAKPIARGAYFGVNSLALAIGGGIGQIAGGSMVDLARTLSFPALPWVVSSAVGIVAGIGMWHFYRHNRAVVTPVTLLGATGA